MNADLLIYKLFEEFPIDLEINNENLKKAFEIIVTEYGKWRKEIYYKKKRNLSSSELAYIRGIARPLYDKFIDKLINIDKEELDIESSFYEKFKDAELCSGCKKFLKQTYLGREYSDCLSSRCKRCIVIDHYKKKLLLLSIVQDWFEDKFEDFINNKISIELFYHFLTYIDLPTNEKNRKIGKEIRSLLEISMLEEFGDTYGESIIKFIANYKKKYERAFSYTIEIESPEGQD